MLKQSDVWEVEQSSGSGQGLDLEIEKIEAKLRRLADLYVDGALDRAGFTARKKKLLNEKIALTERLELNEREGILSWLEPLRDLLNSVRERSLPTVGGDLLELRDFVAEVGSNLALNSRKVLWDAPRRRGGFERCN